MALSKFKSSSVTADQRLRMIAEAAYFRAERRGFRNGDPSTDWIEAEAEIDCLLNSDVGGFRRPEAKHSYQEMLETQLEEWDEKLAEITVTAKKAGTKLRSELENRLVDLEKQRAAARMQLAQLREHGEETWQDLRQNADRLWDELRVSFDNLMSQLKITGKAARKNQETHVK